MAVHDVNFDRTQQESARSVSGLESRLQAATSLPRHHSDRAFAQSDAGRLKAGLQTSGLLSHNSVRMTSAAEGGVIGDKALAVQIIEAIVHQVHAVFSSGLDGVLELVELILSN